MKKSTRPINKVLLVMLLSLLFATTTHAQSSDLAAEKLKADALAYAYVNCDFSLSAIQLKEEPENKDLQVSFSALTLLRNKMILMTIGKYKDGELKKKFDKEVELAEKQLTKCVKYNSLTEEEAEKEKEDTKEKTE